MDSTSVENDRVLGVEGIIPGSWWRKPAALRRLEALSSVRGQMYPCFSWADGNWFYYFSAWRSELAWICLAVGIRNPEEALMPARTVAAVDRDSEASSDQPPRD